MGIFHKNTKFQASLMLDFSADPKKLEKLLGQMYLPSQNNYKNLLQKNHYQSLKEKLLVLEEAKQVQQLLKL